MSSDEEDLDLNDETSQLDNNSEDGDNLESEVDLIDQSVQNSPAPQQEIPTKRNIQLQLNQNKIDCQSYDIVPLVAVIHPNPIYSLAATRCFRWIFTGSDDGYVRKWDFFASMNGKTSLSQAQRHHFVDSITMSGVISSWWENTEPPEPIIKIEPSETNSLGSTEQTASPSSSISHSYPTPTFNNNNSEPKLSPVYSMDVQSDALWALQGTESGAIQLVTVRHDEGKSHHVFKKHTGPVSVLRIHPDETGFLSGSWDKTILEWDLQQGSLVRDYNGHISQVSSISYQPIYTPYIPPTSSSSSSSISSNTNENKSTIDNSNNNNNNNTTNESTNNTTVDSSSSSLLWDQKNPNIFLSTSIDGQCFLWDKRVDKDIVNQNKLNLPMKNTPPWCLSACWSSDGSKIYIGRRNGTVDEWDYTSQKFIQSFKMPLNSGPVSYVTALPNGKHIICASNDNIRLWDTSKESSFNIKPNVDPTKSSVIPFTVLPGHHGGVISNIVIDPTCSYMVTASGTRGWDGQSTNVCLFYDITSVI